MSNLPNASVNALQVSRVSHKVLSASLMRTTSALSDFVAQMRCRTSHTNATFPPAQIGESDACDLNAATVKQSACSSVASLARTNP